MGCSPTEQILLQGSKNIKTHMYEFAKRLAVFPSESFSQSSSISNVRFKRDLWSHLNQRVNKSINFPLSSFH